MKFFANAAALAALAKVALAQGTLFINTPASIVQCQPTLLNFGGGTAPYFLSVLPAGQATANPILTLPDQTAAGSYTWTVSLPAGTNITLQVRDGTGAVNYGSPVVVQPGTSESCIDQAAASSASSATAAGGGVVATGASSAAGSSAASASSLVSSTGSVTVTAASGTPSTTATTSAGNDTSSASGNFTCTEGLLTYGISISSLGDASLTEARNFFNNLAESQPTATNVSGTEVTFEVGNLTYSLNVTTNETSSDGTLRQQLTFLGSEPVELGNGTILYDAFEDLTVYRNSTSNETQVQYFILGCFNDQSAGLATLSQIISAAVSYWGEQLSGGSSGGSGGSSSGNSTSTSARRLVKLF